MTSIQTGIIPKKHYIQALRAFAALIVILFHYPGGTVLGRQGFIGVDLFFVISGYIMTLTTAGNDGSWRYCHAFFVKRLSRIWPVYAVLTILVMFVTIPMQEWMTGHHFKHLAASLVFMPLWQEMAILKQGWTLNFEMYFYLLFGIGLLAGKYRWVVFFGLVVMMLGVVPSPPDMTDYSWNGVLAMMTNAIIWNFVIGVGIGLLAPRIKLPSPFLRRILIGLTILYLVYQYATRDDAIHGIFWGVPFGLLILFLEIENNHRQIKIPRFVHFLGDISYSLYLTQSIVIFLFEKYASVLLTDRMHRIAFLPLYLVCIFILSVASYFILEKGLSQKVKDALSAR